MASLEELEEERRTALNLLEEQTIRARQFLNEAQQAQNTALASRLNDFLNDLQAKISAIAQAEISRDRTDQKLAYALTAAKLANQTMTAVAATMTTASAFTQNHDKLGQPTRILAAALEGRETTDY
jgi:hypothetical protein